MSLRWHILGAGAIGALFASSLHRAGISTTLLCRGTNSRKLTREISLDKGNITSKLSFPTSNNGDPDPISHLLVTTKAYDVHSALAEVSHRLDAGSHIIILVNGMGFMEGLKRDFPQFEFTLGTTTEGAYRVGAGHFCHAGNGLTRLGLPGKTEPPPWYRAWSKIDLPCVWETNIEEVIWQKLCINCAINPLTALHQCKNGELATQPALASLVEQLCNEIAQVSMAAGYENTSISIHQRVTEVIADTADNRSSMLQDVQAGRRTEIEYISGYFIALAKQLEITIPVTMAVFEAGKNRV